MSKCQHWQHKHQSDNDFKIKGSHVIAFNKKLEKVTE
jgi:hypothetical protein